MQFEIPDGYRFTVPNRVPDFSDSDVVSDTIIGEAAPIQIKTQGKDFGKVGAGLVK